MQRFLTHLILIVYLVGGWLLPVTHQHASQTEAHSHASGISCCDSSVHDHEMRRAGPVRGAVCSVDTAYTPMHACDCEHEAVADPPIVDGVIWSSPSHPHDCFGLCAGCVAQSLVGIHVWDRAEWIYNANVHSVALADPGLVVSQQYGFALSRGPPSAV